MSSPFDILIVERSPEFQKVLLRTLRRHKLKSCSSTRDASHLLGASHFDLVIIDINFPNRDGFELLAEIRATPAISSLPILCLSNRNEITDKVTAFSLGADDYIIKPFEPIELQARVEAKLRRAGFQAEDQAILTVGDIEIDLARHRVAVNTESAKIEVPVTQTEFKLLCCLARRPEKVYSRDQLLVAVWGSDAPVLDRAVDVHICLLRKKLGDVSHYIKAVTGVGYKLVPKAKNRHFEISCG